MTTCVVVGAIVVSCVVDPATRPSPAEAAAILAPYQFVAPPPIGGGPTFAILASSPTAGPFGEFRPFSPARRLDGTLLSQRPWIMRAYVGRRPGERFEQGQHLPPAFVGTGRGIGASAGPPGPGSIAGGVTKTSSNPRKEDSQISPPLTWRCRLDRAPFS